IRTGLALAIPAGYEAQVRPRSGLALKHGLTLPNAPATIDSDYRGELMIPLINLGTEPVAVTRGMRIAQLVFQRVERVELVAPEALAALEADVNRLRQEVSEMQERLDFAERLLAQGPERRRADPQP